MGPYPVLPVIMPTDLQRAQNGLLDPAVLRNVNPKGQLYRIAATAFNCLQLNAFFDGISVNPIGVSECYRNLDRQKTIFFERYQLTPSGRSPEITRNYDGRIWYLKAGRYAPCASPGTSNHGWGLAVDIADCWVGSKTLDWLYGDGSLGSKAIQYGFSWEIASGPQAESWHIRYVCGDRITAATEVAIKMFPSLDVR